MRGVIGRDLRSAHDHDARPAFTASPNAFPALKDGAFEAGIDTLSAVRGLRPVRARRSFVANVPKPAIRTSSFAKASEIASRTASRAPSAADVLIPAWPATRAMISAFFIPWLSAAAPGVQTPVPRPFDQSQTPAARPAFPGTHALSPHRARGLACPIIARRFQANHGRPHPGPYPPVFDPGSRIHTLRVPRPAISGVRVGALRGEPEEREGVARRRTRVPPGSHPCASTQETKSAGSDSHSRPGARSATSSPWRSPAAGPTVFVPRRRERRRAAGGRRAGDRRRAAVAAFHRPGRSISASLTGLRHTGGLRPPPAVQRRSRYDSNEE